MSKRAEEAALKAYPVHEGASPQWIKHHLSGGDCAVFIQGYMQAEKVLAKALLAKYKEESDKCPDADYDHDYTVAETQQCGRFMMMEDIYEEFCEPVGVTLDDLEDEQ